MTWSKLGLPRGFRVLRRGLIFGLRLFHCCSLDMLKQGLSVLFQALSYDMIGSHIS